MLRCVPLAGLAPHLFTARNLELRDNPAEWEAVARQMGVPRGAIRLIRQVHGAAVAVARRGEPCWTLPEADAVVTDDPSVAIAVRVADCAPVLLADARRGTVGAVHAGWRGTVQGVVGAAVLLRSSAEVARRVVARGRDPETVTTAVFAITAIVLYLLPLGVLRQGYWFDRYLLPVLPLAMILAWTSSNASPQRAHGALGALLIVPYGLFAVAATHDYLSWSRARWQAVEVLLSEPGVSLEDVDAGGGREVKGWHLGHRVTRCDGDRGRETTAAPSWGDC